MTLVLNRFFINFYKASNRVKFKQVKFLKILQYFKTNVIKKRSFNFKLLKMFCLCLKMQN